jgi:GTP-binding protein
MTLVLALVGRPNVGKSTLFNCLTKSKSSLVANISGLTRDRKFGKGMLNDKSHVVIDTGGISGNELDIDKLMADQSLKAIEQADIVMLVVDAKEGLVASDEDLISMVRKKNKNFVLVINKVDKTDKIQAIADFSILGIEHTFAVSAVNKSGVKPMIDEILNLPTINNEDNTSDQINDIQDPEKRIKISIVGRPNVGKSTLVNRILGENRVVISDLAGTTRDSIYIPFDHEDKKYTLIDTAGVRRKGKTNTTIEKFSVVRTLQAIEDSNVTILVINAHDGIVEHDLHLIGHVLDSGRAMVIAINKWDGLSQDAKDTINSELSRRLHFIDYIKIHKISAKYGSGVGTLYGSIEKAYTAATSRYSTNKLTRILEDATQEHQPPMVNNKRIKLKYCHLGGLNPPTIVVHGNQTGKIPESYRRYLENTFRKVLNISGTPLRVDFKSPDNPYAPVKQHKKAK